MLCSIKLWRSTQFFKTFCEKNLLEKKRSAAKELDLLSKYFPHRLYDDQQAIILNTITLVNKGNYYFKAPMTLIPKSASSWIKDDLDKLKVCFVEKECFHAFSNITTSSKSLGLIDKLKDLAESNYCKEYSNFSRDDAFRRYLLYRNTMIMKMPSTALCSYSIESASLITGPSSSPKDD
jgi:hypothetical protein